MIDSGATALFIHKDFCKRKNILTVPLKKEIALYNIDGTRNTAGSITYVAKLTLTVGTSSSQETFLVMNVGPEDVILGLPLSWNDRCRPTFCLSLGSLPPGPTNLAHTSPKCLLRHLPCLQCINTRFCHLSQMHHPTLATIQHTKSQAPTSTGKAPTSTGPNTHTHQTRCCRPDGADGT